MKRPLRRKRSNPLQQNLWPEPEEIEWDPGSIFEHVYRRLKPRTPVPQVDLEFKPFAGMNHRVRLRDGRLEVRLSDLLAGAPPAVVEALATILLGKLYRRETPAASSTRYRRYVNSAAVRRRILAARRQRGRKHAGPEQHGHRDLGELFDRLNARYFAGLLPRPRLAWSHRHSRTHLGHYDPAHHTIVISRMLDRPEIPLYAAEYILYHEMLHLRFPVEVCGGRRRVHSPAFQREEKRFAEYKEARLALKALPR
jgi:hypothetical protein